MFQVSVECRGILDLNVKFENMKPKILVLMVLTFVTCGGLNHIPPFSPLFYWMTQMAVIMTIHHDHEVHNVIGIGSWLDWNFCCGNDSTVVLL